MIREVYDRVFDTKSGMDLDNETMVFRLIDRYSVVIEEQNKIINELKAQRIQKEESVFDKVLRTGHR